MANHTIINAVSRDKVPSWGNGRKYIAVHYLGVTGENHDLMADGCGAHYYVYHDGTIYQRCSHDAIVWQVGTAGCYVQKHPEARNANTIGIEMCCYCDGNAQSAEDPKWWFTEATQEATVWLVRKIMADENIPADHVLRHYDIVNKTCPAPYVHNNGYRGTWTWEQFMARVKGDGKTASSGGGKAVEVPNAKTKAPTITKKITNRQLLVDAAEDIGRRVAAEIAAGIRWEYRNDWFGAYDFEEAVRENKRYISCAGGVIWAVRGSGVCSAGGWWGRADGEVNYPDDSTRAAIAKAFKITDGGGKTVGELVKAGTIKAGSVITLRASYNHTFLYLGAGRWYDAGHAHCTGGGEGAPFWAFVSESTPYIGETVGKVLTPKGSRTITETAWFRVGTGWKDGKCVGQVGAYEYLENAVANCGAGLKVFDHEGRVLYDPKKGASSTTPAAAPAKAEETKTTRTTAADFDGLTEAQAAAKILEMARAEGERSGILPSLIAAQAILESGYCHATELVKKANNAFGMKTSLSGNSWASHWDGVSKVTIRTPEEYTPGVITYITADFRAYPCLEASFADHSDYLLGATFGGGKRYAGLTDCADYKAAAQLVKNGGYATDSRYVAKLCSLVERYGLDKYDAAVVGKAPAAVPAALPEEETQAATELYRVGRAWVDGRCADQVGAFRSIENAKAAADAAPSMAVFDQAGKTLYRSKAGKRKAVVMASVLRVRKGAGMRYEVVDKLPRGTEVTVVGTNKKGNWTKLAPGRWVATKYLTF